ncbi:sensor histidine kinase, partial [Massilia agilis]
MLRTSISFERGVLHRRVFASILAGFAPLVLLSYLTLSANAEHQKRELIAAVQHTMRALTMAVDAELQVSQAALDTLATSARLKAGDMAGFHAEARELLRRHPNWANIVLSTPDARQVLNTRRPFGSALPSRVDPEGVERVGRSAQPGVGNIVVGPLLKKPSFAVYVPVRLDGPQRAYVLAAPTLPSSLQDLIRRQDVPDGALVSIADRNDNIVARSLNGAELIGKPLSPTLRQVLREGRDEGWAVTTTLEGAQVYAVYKRSPVTGWTAVIGIPVDAIDAPVRRTYRLLAGSILIASLLGLGVALAFARSVTRPMLQLRESADAMGRGAAPDIPGTDIPEIRKVGEAMAQAHEERARLLASEREAHRQERQARLAAEEASRAKDEFLAMLGHELRNPLAPICSAAELLQRQAGADAAVARLSAIVRRQADHLRRLVDDILDVSRVTRKLVALRREPVDVNTLLPQAVEQVQEQVAAQGLQLSVQACAQPAWVLADPTRIVQVLVNLLGNAAKFTPAGGHITLAVAAGEGSVRITVQDDGIGIAPTLLPRVFELFTQAERPLDRAQGGLGLGLPLVRGLVQLHDGRVEAASGGEGQGATFVVELPRIAAPGLVAA